jgi:hypothetical protein
MADDIPKELVDRMMVKCGRRCCICRRFRPTKLQVHHIVERGQGGGNDEGNLIVICFSCHSDVHTKVPFARRFTVEELKGHRDGLVRMVEQGKLPIDDTDDLEEVLGGVARTLQAAPRPNPQLLPEAVQLLVGAVSVPDAGQGGLLVSESFEGLSIGLGGGQRAFNIKDQRTAAKYKHAMRQLVQTGLIACVSPDVFEVTYEGYLLADDAMANEER